MPLVEIVKGVNTAPETVQWLGDFYKSAGKAPLVLSREIPGFIATRLQEAIWREALHMVAHDEATVEEIDSAIVNGTGHRWALMVPCMTCHTGCGYVGMAVHVDQYGLAFRVPLLAPEVPELTPELRQRMVEGCRREAGDRDYTTLNRERDLGLVAITKALKTRA